VPYIFYGARHVRQRTCGDGVYTSFYDLVGLWRIVNAHEQHRSGDLVEHEVDERMVAPELEGLDRPGRPGHQERRGRRGNRALFVHGDFRLVHGVVDGHVVRVTGQRRQVYVAFEHVSDSHLLQ